MCFGAILLLSVISRVSSGWNEGRGLNLGYGASLHLDRVQNENTSLLERRSLRLEYNGIKFSVNKNPSGDNLQFDVFYGGLEEGRSKKVGEIFLPALIGIKFSGLAAIALSGIAVFVLKALAVTKLALVVSAGLMVAKLFLKTKNNQMKMESYPESHPVFPQYSIAGGVEDHYLNYPNYGSSGTEAIGDSSGHYSSLTVPSNETTLHTIDSQSAHRRRDVSPGMPQTYLTFRT